MKEDVIHNIWLHMCGKAEGLAEAGMPADLPVMFANAILEYAEVRRKWISLTGEERDRLLILSASMKWDDKQIVEAIEAILKEKNI